MRKRSLLNCWIVAAYLWLSVLFSKVRRYAWMRKSTSFKGSIIHAGVAQAVSWRTLTVVEFIPTKAEFGTLRNFLILFRGRFRVWKFRVEKVRRFDSMEEALEFANFKQGA